MSDTFEREERYLVLKLSDVEKYLTLYQTNALMDLACRVVAGLDKDGKPSRASVVVEADWPEYGMVWDAIKERTTKAARQEDDLIEQIKLRMDMCSSGEDMEDPEEAAFFTTILARLRRLERERDRYKELADGRE